MAITTPEAFLKALGKSQLLTPEQLAQAQDTLLLAESAEQFAEILIDSGLLTEWQATRLIAGQTEFIIGKYVLLGLLGRGGMGSVFLARHTDMKRQVALKIISKRVGKDPTSRERFKSEARTAASLDHPNIVRAFDIDKDRERFYIVMEYVDGHDIEELVEVEGPLDFEFIVDCIRQTAKGLAHAHGRGMIHCDIKPSNLLVTETGTLKILDMGMARLITQSTEDSSSDSNGRILGTVDYMSPEQAVEGPDFDHRADIYSLGCTMYYMLTGHPPFDEGTLAQRIVQHQTKAPPDILAEHPDVPPELVQICMKMMAKDPADRFQSAEELIEVLDRWHPPEPEPLSDPSASDGPKSTGVAIDEEDYSIPQPLEPSSQSPKSFLSDERRLVFWMAIAAVIIGGLLAIVAVLLVLHSNAVEEESQTTPSPHYLVDPTSENGPEGSSSTSKPEREPTPATHDPNTSTSKTSTKKPPKGKASRRNGNRIKQNQRKGGTSSSVKKIGSTAGQQDGSVSTSGGGSSRESDVKPPAGQQKKPPKSQNKPRPQKVINPFKNFPGLVELPPTSRTDRPTVLGKLYLAKGNRPAIQLLGGTSAIQGESRFILVDRPESSEWLFRLVDVNNHAKDIARLQFRDNKIMFTWLETSADTPAAYLRNCLLKIDVDRASRFIRLVKPKAITPLTIELSKSKAGKRLFANKYPPKNTAMQLVITAIDGLPNQKDPKKTVTVRLKPSVALKPGESDKITLLQQGGCRIELRTKYTLQGPVGHLDVNVYYHLATRRQMLKITPKRILLLDTQRIVNERKIAGFQTALKNNPDLAAAKKKARQREINELQGEIDWITQFLEWHQETGGIIRVQFQECMVVDKHRVVILDARASNGQPPVQNKTSKTRLKKRPSITPSSKGEKIIFRYLK